MARIVRIYCTSCNQHKDVSAGVAGQRTPTICGKCTSEKKEAERKATLDHLATRPISERLARLEALQYDHEQVRHYQGPLLT